MIKPQLLLATVALLAGFTSSALSQNTGRINQQAQAITNFKTSGRAQVSRVAVLYPGAQASRLQDQLVTQLADAFFTHSIGYTTARIDSELSQSTAAAYLHRFEPSHALWVYAPMQRTLNGQLIEYTVEIHLVDAHDGVRVWRYQADVKTGKSASVRDVVNSVMSEMKRDGILGTVGPIDPAASSSKCSTLPAGKVCT